MPKLTSSNPTYRHHRPSGQAVVTLSGRDHYLGPHGSKTSREKYDRLIGEWLTNGRRAPDAGSDLTVSELIAGYWEHATVWYRHRDGTPTSEQAALRLALGVLARLYGPTLAASFGPLALQTVRNAMIAKGWGRKSINVHVGRIKRAFGWGVTEELIPGSVTHGLAAVPGLRAGRSAARETDPVKPVTHPTIEQTLPHLPAMIAAMVRLQLLTGARPGEVCGLRTADIDRSGEVWIVTPADHKTAHHGRARAIHIGPQAQPVLLPYLNLADPAACVFSPAASERARRAAANAARVTPLKYGNRPGSNVARRPKVRPGDHYTVTAYRHAIARACDAAFPPPAELAQRPGESVRVWEERLTPDQVKALAKWRSAHRWHPHQLRHTRATDIRKSHGIEAAQHVLGHATLSVTEVYAERDAESAWAVALAIG